MPWHKANYRIKQRVYPSCNANSMKDARFSVKKIQSQVRRVTIKWSKHNAKCWPCYWESLEVHAPPQRVLCRRWNCKNLHFRIQYLTISGNTTEHQNILKQRIVWWRWLWSSIYDFDSWEAKYRNSSCIQCTFHHGMIFTVVCELKPLFIQGAECDTTCKVAQQHSRTHFTI